MTDDDRLHDALTGLVPTPPLAPERAASARSYATRARRGRIAAGAAAAVVAAAIVVPFALGNGGANRGAPQPAPSPGVVAGDFDCPAPSPDKFAPEGPLPGPDKLPDGPIAVRICFPGGLPWQAPRDALITDPGRVADAINDLPTEPRPTVCRGNLGPTWGMSFQYADGHTQFVRGRSFGCGGIDLGGAHRGGDADAPLRLVQDLLSEQRGRMTPPPLGDQAPDCDHVPYDDGPGLTMMPFPHPLQLSRGVVCWRYATHSVQPMNSAQLSPDELAVLVDDYNAHYAEDSSPHQGCTQVVTVSLDGITAWGDELRLDSSCGYFITYFGEQNRWWKPDQQSQAILDRLISKGPLEIPLPSAETPPDEVVNAWVDLFNNDRPERANQLWVGDQPTLPGVDRIELKISAVTVIVPGSTTPEASYQQVRGVTAAYREVPLDADFGERVFTLVRNSDDEPWQILSYGEPGAAGR